jgi:hypothetical protein
MQDDKVKILRKGWDDKEDQPQQVQGKDVAVDRSATFHVPVARRPTGAEATQFRSQPG